jgi:fructose-bisphosphate aldolase class 1
LVGNGVILYDETIRQSTSDGTPIPQYLMGRGIAPGIKVDTGAKPLVGSPREKVTEGSMSCASGLRRLQLRPHAASPAGANRLR